jgi:hypothetical protein
LDHTKAAFFLKTQIKNFFSPSLSNGTTNPDKSNMR